MTPKKLLAIILLVVGLISLAFGLKMAVFDRQSHPTSSLRVDSFPKTKVFLNDKEVGETSLLLENLSPGEQRLKLGTWEAKIKLVSGTLTYVSRVLGQIEDLSGGQILMLERLPLESSKELAVVSDPDNASVTIDGQDEGKTSLVFKNLTTGDHEIVVSLPSYSDQVIHGKIIGGYRLNIVAKLAKLSGEIASPSAQPTVTLVSSQSGEITKSYVVIKETETGFLRVRADPNISATETARVKPGEKYPLLQEILGWVKIKLPTLFGWVSDAYVEKVK